MTTTMSTNEPDVVMVAGTPSDGVRMGGKIDPEILPLVKALRRSGVDTLGSCCGHCKSGAYVDLAVHGLRALRHFVRRMNLVNSEVEAEGLWLDVALNWRDDVVTACSFASHPSWIMLSLTIEDADRDGPSKAALKRIADVYARA